MKKLLAVMVLGLALTACGSKTGKKDKVTVCGIDSSYAGYSNAQQTIISDGDIAKKIQFEATLDFPDKATLEATLPKIDEALATVNSLDGVKASYLKLSDTSLKDIAEYDLDKASLETLQKIGLLQTSDESAKLISVKQSVKLLEASGFTCTVQD